VERLHPGLVIYHRPSDRYQALAADVQEEFRYLVDLLALRLVHLGMVSPADFKRGEKSQIGVLIGPEARRTIIGEWHARLNDRRRPEGEKEGLTHRQIMHRQVKRLKAFILDPEAQAYQAHRGE
jgi:CRISPR/Cas system-associated endonuclease Cas1